MIQRKPIQHIKMKKQDYTATITISKTPEEIFNSINSVPKWWIREVTGAFTEFEGESSKLNDVFILRHSDVHYSKHQLTDFIPDKKVIWLVTDSQLNWIKGNKQEWTGTKMVFEIVPAGENTILNFTHDGLVPHLECYGHSVHFWERVIGEWLFNFITKDQPHI